MNTEQNYVGRDSHANTTPKTGQSIEEILAELEKSRQVSEEGRILEIETLLPMRKWAEDTIAQAEKGRFLGANEKRTVRTSLTLYIDQMDFYLRLAKGRKGLYSMRPEESEQSIANWLQGQADMNQQMSWFELAPYPVPSHIQPRSDAWRNRRQHFDAFHDKMSPMIKKGDDLSCVILDQAKGYKKGDVVSILLRARKDRTRKFCFGRVRWFDANFITLSYDHPAHKEEYYTIHLSKVLFVLKVEQAQSPATSIN